MSFRDEDVLSLRFGSFPAPEIPGTIAKLNATPRRRQRVPTSRTVAPPVGNTTRCGVQRRPSRMRAAIPPAESTQAGRVRADGRGPAEIPEAAPANAPRLRPMECHDGMSGNRAPPRTSFGSAERVGSPSVFDTPRFPSVFRITSHYSAGRLGPAGHENRLGMPHPTARRHFSYCSLQFGQPQRTEVAAR